MPLIQSDSDKALQKNIETEIKAGREKNQAIAIALDVQRRAKAKKRRQAKHSIVDPPQDTIILHFDDIEKQLLNATPEETEHGTYIRVIKLGSVEELAPSGKYFICWTEDHSNPEIEADVKYWQACEEAIQKFSFPAWLEHDLGNIYVGAFIESDQPQTENEIKQCTDCGNDMNECYCGYEYSVTTGDMVGWQAAGGRAEGKIKKIIKDGDVPGIPVKVTGTKESPAALIEVYRDGKPSGTMVGHKLDSLNKK